MAELEIKNYQIIAAISGKSLEGTAYDYPLKDIIPKQAELETKHPLFTTS
jgi:isoleucyl-tRNA synthetase